MTIPLVVVGGSVATTAFIERMRELGNADPITVVDADPDAPYDRPPLSKHRYLIEARAEEIALDWSDLDVTMVRSQAVGVDWLGHLLQVRDEHGQPRDISYGRLVIATGASPARLPIEPPNTVVLRSAADARHVRTATADNQSVIIIGAGAIGVELASSLASSGSQVRLLDRAAGPLERLLAGHLAAETTTWLEEAGIVCRWGVGIAGIGRAENEWEVELDGGECLRADVLISAVGARPAVDWLSDSQLLTDGVLLADDRGRVTTPNGLASDIYAIGDVVTRLLPDGTRERTESWAAARQHGTHLAEVLSGAESQRAPAQYFWTEVAGRIIQIVGVLQPNAKLEVVATNPERRSVLYRVTGGPGEADAWIGVNAQPLIARIQMGEQGPA